MRRVAILGVALFAATACRTPIPALVALPPDDPRPARLLEAWASGARERQSLRGRASVSVDAGDGELRLRGRQLLVAERPARLRIEIQGMLNQSVAVLVTDGEQFELFRADDRSYQTGPVDADLLWRHAWLALSPGEVIGLLLGAPDPDRSLAPLRALGDAEGRVQLDLGDADGRLRQRVGFDREGRLRRLEVFGPGGALAWTAEFDDYEPVGATSIAHSLSLDVAAGRTHAEIQLRDVQLNPQLPPGLFRLRAPAGGASTGQGG